MTKGYILVTAAKNEGKNLPELIQSVAEQTIKPLLWVIVDDASTDNTPQILEDASRRYEWIKTIRLEERSERDLGFHLSRVVKMAFDFAADYCREKGIDYKYMGNIDGDMIIEREFFEKLIREFEKDPKLGIAGSGTQYIVNGKIIQPKGGEDEPSGGDMLIRRECFEDCCGIQITLGWDSTLKAKAKIRGWKVRRFEHVKAIETRLVGSVEGYWERYKHMGEAAYYFNLHPVHVVLKSIRMILRSNPHYKGIAYIAGYLSSLLRRRQKIDDEEIRAFFWNKWRYKMGGWK